MGNTEREPLEILYQDDYLVDMNKPSEHRNIGDM